MAATSYAVTERALCSKRRSFTNKLTTILEEANTDLGLSKKRFEEKKALVGRYCEEIVSSTEGCIKLTKENEREEHISELHYQVDILKVKKSIPMFRG